ncbi:hypothetical protein HYH02_005632 [Chlamydomonas schloesseri]|uniref:Origin recognition complex subunit 1 n=1 Tax=Chlamydomonas schloesseri TaxID=2026947 RepID=A0A835WKR1_9CHLO|nr:hypothetical protein HYH02_005632 [Chlamydomonas schloesseri]|eukprot:KAG2449488.1 hypothetical protein HYH02_005632 [Chlamydomonas schloesseri]
MSSRPRRTAGGVALVQEVGDAGPAQGKITDVFRSVKGSAAAHKQQKTVAIITNDATERTLARAARTAAATQQAATLAPAPPPATTPKRKRRGEQAEPRDEDDDDDVVLIEDHQQQQDEDMDEAAEAAVPAAKTPSGRGRGRRAAAAAAAPAEPGTDAGTSAPAQRRSTRAKPTATAAAAAEAPAGGKASGPTARRKRGGEPGAAAGGAAAAAAGGGRATVRYMSSWEVHGERIHVGDDVYVVETEDASQLPGDDEDEPCCVCSKNTDTRRMVECDRCLRGFHFRCLKPPLKKLPEGDWLCPDCVAGVPATAHANRHIATSSQAFLFGNKVLGLARVTGWMKDRKGEVQVLVRHYKKPEETHLGRQAHHHAREVFLGVGEHLEAAACIWGRADVVGPAAFAATGGTDTYICEYEYDDKWKRFRRRLGSDEDPNAAAAASDDDDEWGAAVPSAAPGAGGKRRGGRGRGRGAAASSDDDEYEAEDQSDESDRDEEYKPRNTLDGWVIRKPRGAGAPRPGMPTRGPAPGGRGRGHSYKALLDEEGSGLLLDQGAAAVPERGPVAPLAAARRALALNNTVGGLPCRETEKAALRRFIGGAVEEGGDSPGVLYICGVPGTGKTACCMEVLGGVRQQAQASGVQLVILNALQLPSPQHVYSKLWERMSGQRWGPARALKALEEAFSGGAGPNGGGRRHMTLLIVDEIDVLITKDQAVLYNLFEWPMREGSRLAVIGISNTHDLDSRVLPRIASRLSGSKLAFNPYNFEQLQHILSSRLQGVTAVAKGAVDFCARKVASTTGDVRRALELLRRAAEIAEGERVAAAARGQPPPEDLTNAVGARQAQAAIKEMYGSLHMTLLRAAGLAAKLVLTALLVESRATNKPEVTVAALHARLTSHLALLTRAAALPLSRVVEAAAALGAQRLVLAEPGWQGPAMRLTLNVPQDDLVTLLRSDPALAAVQSCLA